MSKGTAIVIGVGPGLGLGLARAFHDAGHPVALLGRNAERLEGFARDLEGGETVRAYAADAGDRDALRAAIRTAIDELGSPEALLYNAAFMRGDTPTDGDDHGWETSVAVNVLGAKAAVEAIVPAIKGRGSLLFTGGGFADNPSPEFASLSVGKAAQRAYVKALAAQQKPHGIRATVVTIDGSIDGGAENLSAAALAATYLALHEEDASAWVDEVVVR